MFKESMLFYIMGEFLLIGCLVIGFMPAHLFIKILSCFILTLIGGMSIHSACKLKNKGR